MTKEEKDTANRGHKYFALVYKDLAASETIWKIQYKAEDGSAAAGIQDARIAIIQLETGAGGGTVTVKETTRARVKQLGISKTLQGKGRIKTAGLSKAIRSKAQIKALASSAILSVGANIVDIGKTYLYLPASGSSENIPVSFEWYIPSNRWGKTINFQLQIDKTSDAFGDLEVEKKSYQDSGFEYFDGADWVALPTSGVVATYAGNLARFITNLTNGLKHWRVRAFAG
jgi:hypothetical protein